MTDARTARSGISPSGGGKGPEDERPESAHEAIEIALAGLAQAPARSREETLSAVEVVEAEVQSGQVHEDATMARADEQLAQIVDDAEVQTYRAIHGASENVDSKKEVVPQGAAAGIAKAEETAAQRGGESRSSAIELAEAATHTGQVHEDATMARADEQLAQIVDDAEVETYRTIHRANEEADSK